MNHHFLLFKANASIAYYYTLLKMLAPFNNNNNNIYISNKMGHLHNVQGLSSSIRSLSFPVTYNLMRQIHTIFLTFFFFFFINIKTLFLHTPKLYFNVTLGHWQRRRVRPYILQEHYWWINTCFFHIEDIIYNSLQIVTSRFPQ